MVSFVRNRMNHIGFSDAIFDTIEASTNHAPIVPQVLDTLVKDLRCILDIVGKEGEAANVQQWREGNSLEKIVSTEEYLVLGTIDRVFSNDS
ncbi:hypothetical protein BTUL_0289g00030 [Botrytis tulipae]|uniref:Uncharacterized protein n=1 Tax=Botrytis tulipae TaxID=87230 RepID=A0A4Z1EDB1_9HELO|nr:hypothetical protein BTUL_0289g00030 [Botrytis tulipae]